MARRVTFSSDAFVLAVASIGVIDYSCPVAKMTIYDKANFNSKVISKVIPKVSNVISVGRIPTNQFPKEKYPSRL